MTLELGQRFSLANDVHIRRFDDDLILLDLQQGRYFALNEIGATLVEKLTAGQTLGHVIEELLHDYEVTREELLSDVEGLVRELSTQGLMIPLLPPPDAEERSP